MRLCENLDPKSKRLGSSEFASDLIWVTTVIVAGWQEIKAARSNTLRGRV